jgi:hypothetical protein
MSRKRLSTCSASLDFREEQTLINNQYPENSSFIGIGIRDLISQDWFCVD